MNKEKQINPTPFLVDMATKAVKIEIIARETIKPSSPTPHHLRHFKLSLLDQIHRVHYAPLLQFYTNTINDDHSKAAKSLKIKTSLSETLTRFYPYAGIIKNHAYVECNDYGVEYIEASANCFLSDILQQPDFKVLQEFLPIELDSKKASSIPLLVKTTFFKCGGMAIASCFSHTIGDGNATTTFINSWAATARGQLPMLPEYVTSSLFPSDDSFVPFKEYTKGEYVTKRFVFYDSKIKALIKRKIASVKVPTPTRVEALTSLIWKCITTASRSSRGFPRLSISVQVMNLRKKVVPPLPENSAGNVLGYFSASTKERDINLQDLVFQIRKGKQEFSKNGLQAILENKSHILIPIELQNQVAKGDIDLSLYTSVSRYALYDADFGWGKPTWTTVPYYNIKNYVVLLATQDGEGIEALVTLSKEDMAVFECDPELLAFAAFNPSVFKNTAVRSTVLSRPCL